MKKKNTVLLIEDERDIADIMKEYFERHNINLLVSHTRTDAFFKINNQKFDCIVSDIKLDQNDVIPVFNELRTNQKGLNYNVPVIVHSGNVTGEILKDNKSIIKAVFVKPNGAEEIIESVKNLIRKPKKTPMKEAEFK